MRVREGVFVLLVTAALLLYVVPRAGAGGAGETNPGARGDTPAAGAPGDARDARDGTLPGAGGADGPLGGGDRGAGAGGEGEARGDAGDAAAGAPGSPGSDDAPPTMPPRPDAGASRGRAGARDAAAGADDRAPATEPPPPALRVDTLARAVPLGEIFFPPNSTALSDDARRRLDLAARDYRAAGSDMRPLLLTGHADQRGDPQVNARISRARAEAVAEYLVARGVPPERIEVRYAGASRPMASGRSPEANASNRRVVVEMLPERAPR